MTDSIKAEEKIELIKIRKFSELPKRDMYAYTAMSMEEAVEKHLKARGSRPVRVWQWGGMYYMDNDVDAGRKRG
jgi:hypothetical protein